MDAQMHDIGTPPQPVAAWLESFARDCEAAAHFPEAILPRRRRYLRARAEALREAAAMIRRAQDPADANPFPIGLGPGESVKVQFQLYPEPDA